MHLKLNNNGKMTSLQIAELTEKPHSDLMKSIRKMEEAWAKINGGIFSLVNYIDAKGEKRPMYELTKTESLYIATKFNDEARAKLILRWEELEKESKSIDFTDPNTIVMIATKWKEETDRANHLAFELEAKKPMINFAEALQTSGHNILIGELAKILKQNGIDIGRNRLFEWLRYKSYLIKGGEQRNLPTQKALELLLFEVKTTTINNPDGSVRVTKTTKVTPKGQLYFINKLLKNKAA